MSEDQTDLRAYLESFDPMDRVIGIVIDSDPSPMTEVDWNRVLDGLLSTPRKPLPPCVYVPIPGIDTDSNETVIWTTDTSTTDAQRKRIVGIVRRDEGDQP